MNHISTSICFNLLTVSSQTRIVELAVVQLQRRLALRRVRSISVINFFYFFLSSSTLDSRLMSLMFWFSGRGTDEAMASKSSDSMAEGGI